MAGGESIDAAHGTTAHGTAAHGTAGRGVVSPTPFGIPTDDVPEPAERIAAIAGDRASGWAAQHRSEVVARRGVVTTSQPLAAQAGLRILQDGGNAVDAAIAAAAVLAVVEPGSCGLGGDAFAIHYSAANRRLYGLNASGPAPAAWTREYFAERGYDGRTGMPAAGVETVTVPGAAQGWSDLLARFGSRDFAQVLAPAIEIAEAGFGITERIHADWTAGVDRIAADPDASSTYLPDGEVPALYGIFRNPELARVLRTIAREGRDGFYRGPLAEAIVAKIAAGGGEMTAADLADFQAEWVEPISVNYGGYDVHQLPPNTQGFAALQMLAIANAIPAVHGLNLAELGPRSAKYWHLLIEAKKLAYSDLHAYNADPRFADVPVRSLISTEYATQQCQKIDPHRATGPAVRAEQRSGTVYLSAADRWGNMISFVYSIYERFGSGVGVPGGGFVLQNRGALFSLDEGSPNVVEPGKRPFHTLLAGFITDQGRPVLSFGNMGGSIQAQAQAVEVISMVTLGVNPQAASDMARFNHDQATDVVNLESGLYDVVGEELAAMGHRVNRTDGASMGGYQAIHFHPETPGTAPGPDAIGAGVNGVYRAASDHRKDGQAAGW